MSRMVFAILTSLSLVSSAFGATSTVNGIDVYWVSEGNGPAIVFVHGWTCDTTVWAEQMVEFRDDYRVIALDLPGHGLSGSPEDGQFTMDLYASAVEAVRVDAGVTEIVLVGHSMGAPVISQYALNYPDRTAGLVAVDGALLPQMRGQPQRQSPEGSMRLLREQMIRSMFVPETSAQVQDKVLHLMLSPSDDRAAAVGSAMATFSSTTGDRIDAPAISVLAGTAAEPDKDALLDFIPKAEVERLEGTGHFLMMEKPAEFNGLLQQFLDRIDF